jgi:hypothetical protein
MPPLRTAAVMLPKTNLIAIGQHVNFCTDCVDGWL